MKDIVAVVLSWKEARVAWDNERICELSKAKCMSLVTNKIDPSQRDEVLLVRQKTHWTRSA